MRSSEFNPVDGDVNQIEILSLIDQSVNIQTLSVLDIFVFTCFYDSGGFEI